MNGDYTLEILEELIVLNETIVDIFNIFSHVELYLGIVVGVMLSMIFWVVAKDGFL